MITKTIELIYRYFISYICCSRFSNDSKSKDIHKLQKLLVALAEQDFTDKTKKKSTGNLRKSQKLQRRASQFIMQPKE